MSDDLFGADAIRSLELLAADNGKAIALQIAKWHGYTHCLLGHVTCPFTADGEEAFAAAWYQGRDIGRNEFIEQVPVEAMFGSQFEGGM